MIAAARPSIMHDLDEQSLTVATLAMIVDGHAADAKQIADMVPSTSLTTRYADVWPAIADELAESPEPNIHGVLNRLKAAGHGQGSEPYIDFIYAAEACTAMTGRAASVARHHAERIIHRHNERTAMAEAERFRQSDGGPDAQADMAAALERLRAPVGEVKTMSGVDAIEALAKNEMPPVVPTSLPWTDGAIGGGLPVGGLVALIAPPGVGKSALALQWIVAALESDPDLRAVWGAGEMTMAGIGARLVAVGSGIVGGCERCRKDDAALKTSRSSQARAAVAAAIGNRITFVEPSLTVAKIDAAVVSTGAKVVMVDYLQLVTVPEGGRDRVADLDRIIGGIRDIATRRGCAVIVASSMPKLSGTTSRAGQLARGSAELDYAADIIFLGDHDGVDENGKPLKASDGTTGVVWRCKKNRSGEQQDLVLRFHGDYQTYNGAAAECQDFAAWASGAPH